ncbi:DELTA-actitoxin-Afr1c-like [Conger conger]|uniref:DELTA-actitoxin-Afr1c-like n=1 Tax=Conger conger TaxID=82655 RepID=UPI002A5A1C41|nr:DELTA-actitoxin-Afr1c-like [Conger conger]
MAGQGGEALAGAVAAGTSAVISGGALVAAITQTSLSSSGRSVSIHLSNFSCDILTNPQVYTYKGYSCTPPHLTLGKAAQGLCTFGNGEKTTGAVGVLTYDINECLRERAVKRLAIMFSVPFEYATYENWFALGFFEPHTPCDEALYNLMYYQDGSFRREKSSGSEIRFESGRYIVKGAMSPMSKAEMKVEFWDDDYFDQFDKY